MQHLFTGAASGLFLFVFFWALNPEKSIFFNACKTQGLAHTLCKEFDTVSAIGLGEAVSSSTT